MKKTFLLLLALSPVLLFAQKKPLDHTVYDGWQSVGERLISNDGKWIVYAVNPQEGDGDLYITTSAGANRLTIPRGSNATVTEDSKYVIFKIKPAYKDTREAKIKKKKPADMPKDSMGIVKLGDTVILKFARIKSFSTPSRAAGWVAFQKEEDVKKAAAPKNKAVDSLKKEIDSLTHIINELKNIQTEAGETTASKDTTTERDALDKGSVLVLRNLKTGKETEFPNSGSFLFDKTGTRMAYTSPKINKDSMLQAAVIVYDLNSGKADTVLRAINTAKQLAFSDDGSLFAFVAESGTEKKALQKYFDLYLLPPGASVAQKIADQHTAGIPSDYMVSDHGNVAFSKNGQRLFFGTAPVPMPKDTSLKEIDEVKLDIWHYQDDYLQPQQLKQLSRMQNRNFLAVYHLAGKNVIQLGDVGLPTIMQIAEGNADNFIATTDTGRRIAGQWTGRTLKDIYSVNVNTGNKIVVKKNLSGNVYPSPSGRYIVWYDNMDSNYHAYDGKNIRNISAGIPSALANELNDVPDYPYPYGVMGWLDGDSAVYIYDRYDIWKVDPSGKAKPVNISKDGRKIHTVYRYTRTDRDEKFLTSNQYMLFSLFNDENKSAGIAEAKLTNKLTFKAITSGDYTYSRPAKAQESGEVIYTKSSYVRSPDLYVNGTNENKLSAINPQQADYNWGTNELFHWTAFDGTPATGVIFKPEDFDPAKKYPVILYFYERLSDNLNQYVVPTPTPSRLNISFFVSRGYIVFTPDIAYKDGHPGESAYNYIVSGAMALAELPYVDEKNMGIQGQSWGGYQVAYLITRTNMFKAAWSGAPVVNMFSAYGGIRWGSGMNRQFQYEKTQSRIGATIWERPDLYVENSPLFHLENVTTPVVIMHNDNDGAVPWYQGIEMFTAMRRLGKKVWLLQYNGEEHNLVQRKNRKDISIREQQYFDWLLKGEKPAKWITEGVPAINKGKDWGLEVK